MKIGWLVIAFIAASSESVASDALQCGGSHALNRITLERTASKCGWPFKPDRIQLVCHGPAQAAVLTVQSAGVEYALNGTARARRFGFRDLDEILIDPPGRNWTQWIEAARQACIAR